MWQKFSAASRKVVFYSQDESEFFKTHIIEPELLLLGIFRAESCIALTILEKYGVTYQSVRDQVISSDQDSKYLDISLSAESKRSIELADACKVLLGEKYITTGSLLLGLFQLNNGLTAKIFSDANMEFETILAEVKEFNGEEH
ncbi:MAG: hypothetical protein KF824_05535 [Fimbriimonadaceae bacterium]|nr:MAG: hypothetical protein KF824_05535 [Fimbriimonadaceae bacterium]